MTTIAVPPTGSPEWRNIYRTPPDVKLNIPAGTWCPIDDTTLQIRPYGWTCPTCKGAWNFQGTDGRWLTELDGQAPSVRWRPSALAMLAGLAGCAAIGAALAYLLNSLDQRLMWCLAAAIAVAAAAIPAYAWAVRMIDNFPYRNNRIVAVHDQAIRALPTASGEASDEQ
jgi:hypothetical protein